MKRLSIIVPMYNVAPFVERCIRSLEDQDIPKEEYEIICVNDGSPDNCQEIVEGLKLEYPNIILINQENQGVSRARNNGIDCATGKYLLFIDPDDFVEARSFSRILKTAEDNGAKVSFLGYTFLNLDGTVRIKVFYEKEKGKIFSGTEGYFLARGDGRTDPDRMWAALFDREFMNSNSLLFLPDVPFLEDGELIARVLCLADRCIFDGNSLYQRTTRRGSATNSNLFHSERATKGFLTSANNLKLFQQRPDLSEQQQEFLNQPILKFILLTLNSSIGWTMFKKLLRSIKLLKYHKLYEVDLRGCRSPYYAYGKAYNLSPWLAVLYLILWPRIYSFIKAMFKKI